MTHIGAAYLETGSAYRTACKVCRIRSAGCMRFGARSGRKKSLAWAASHVSPSGGCAQKLNIVTIKLRACRIMTIKLRACRIVTLRLRKCHIMALRLQAVSCCSGSEYAVSGCSWLRVCRIMTLRLWPYRDVQTPHVPYDGARALSVPSNQEQFKFGHDCLRSPRTVM